MGKLFNRIKDKVEDIKFERTLKETADLLGESDHKTDYELESIYDKAIELVFDRGPSASLLQAKLGISFANAQQMLTRLETAGVVGPAVGTVPRQLLMKNPQQAKIAVGILENEDLSKKTWSITAVDAMEGHEFEHFIANLLKRLGYANVEVTKGSGDQGVDVLAEKDGIRYAIQCKNYTNPLGNTPVQEVTAGKDYYNCHIGVVVTNSYFTEGGKELASRTRVLLWDREKLQEMIEEANI